MTEHAPLPIGWCGLVTDLRLRLQLDFPAGVVTEMHAERGWLHVAVDESKLDRRARMRLAGVVQGAVSQSIHTCGNCGNSHARDRGYGHVPTCDECFAKESADA
jgi:hypothetical protein